MKNSNSNGYTHIAIILDRTGSMCSIQKETINSFNVFVKEQQAVPGKCTLTLVQFDSQDPFEVIYDFVDIQKVKKLTSAIYVPRGYTPLLDAIAMGIDNTGEKLAAMEQKDRPEKLLFVVITDGEENASIKFKLHDVKNRITHQIEKYAWKFVFLGANMDAISVASSMGINVHMSSTYTADANGIKGVYCAMSSGATKYRSASVVDAQSMNFFEDSSKVLGKA